LRATHNILGFSIEKIEMKGKENVECSLGCVTGAALTRQLLALKLEK
jgi:hypothetical protein